MPYPRTPMQKIKRMLALKAAGLGVREIARAVGRSPDTVSVYLRRAQDAGIGWPLPEDATDDELARRLAPPQRAGVGPQFVVPDFKAMRSALAAHKGMRLQILHETYVDEHGERAYSYSRYCELHANLRGPDYYQPNRNDTDPEGDTAC